MDKVMITNVGQIVTPRGNKSKSGREMDDLSVIEDSAILIEDGLIAEIGDPGDFAYLNDDEVELIDAGGSPVLPGFVDPHTHFVFSGYRDEEYQMRLRGKSYEDIAEEGGGINSSVESTRRASFSRLKRESKERLRSMARFGVTTVEGKTGYGLDRETELNQLKVMTELDEEIPVDVTPTFLGAHSIPEEFTGRRDEYVDFVVDEMEPLASEAGAEFCDVFCDRGAFTVEESRRVLTEGKKCGMDPKIHADEITDTGGAGLAAEVGATSADHLLKSSEKGLDLMADKGVVAVLLPLTAFSLREDYARGREMIDSGLSVALATDFNPGSCYSESIPLLFSLASLYMGMSLEESITALTLNAAAAIDRADRIGTIEPGKQADLVILDAPDYSHLAYHIGVNSVSGTIKKGRNIWTKRRPAF